MKNSGNQSQVQQPQLIEGSSQIFKVFGFTALLVLLVLNWNTIMGFLIKLMLNILVFIYGYVGGNFGIAIILFTVLIRLLTWPLTAQQIKGSKAMQELQNDKEWIAVQKKYAKDREKLQTEQFRIQRERGINMFGSCLPTLIQFPILFALFPAVSYAIGSAPLSILNLSRNLYEFQNAAALVPLNSKFLWMDLGLPERTMILGIAIPVLAFILAITTYMQSKLLTPPSANPNDQSAAVNQQMTTMMPVMLFFLFLNYPSGLSIYIIAGNILSIVQYAMMGKVNWRNLLPGSQKA